MKNIHFLADLLNLLILPQMLLSMSGFYPTPTH